MNPNHYDVFYDSSEKALFMNCIFVITLAVTLTLLAPAMAATSLYDTSSSSTPDDDNLYYLAVDPNLSIINTTNNFSNGLTTLNSSADRLESAGYYNFDSVINQAPKTPLTLDRSNSGYTLNFAVQIVNESHVSNDRAGFSAIALSSDGWGIELGFWENRIFAQNGGANLFTQGEFVAFDTTASLTNYQLAVQGSTYQLFGNGNSLLTGALRNYGNDVDSAAENNALNPRHVYFLENFIFLGDDTSSASAETRLGNISVSSVAIPEPSSGLLFLASSLLLPIFRNRKATV